VSAVRVLMVVGSSRGGAAVHVRDLIRGLPSERYAVRVAMPADDGDVAAADLEGAGATVDSVPLEGGFSPGAWCALRRLVRDADIVHVHGARAAFYGRTAVATLRGARPAVVYTVHAFAAPHYGRLRSAALLGIERRLEPYTDAYIAVSAAEREDLLNASLVGGRNIAVILNGVDVDRFRPPTDDERRASRAMLNLPLESRVAIMVCRLFRPRDFETLLIAFREVRERAPQSRLLIVGDGPWRARVAALVDGLWLGEHVRLLGRRDDVPFLLGAADLLLHTTAGWEGMGLSILEGMAAGLPVVASRVGGIPEAVVDGETGILVPPGSPGALADAILKVLTDPALAGRFGRAGRDRAAAEFTLGRMVNETRAVYESVLGSREARPTVAPGTG